MLIFFKEKRFQCKLEILGYQMAPLDKKKKTSKFKNFYVKLNHFI